jgi:hypothetical protein
MPEVVAGAVAPVLAKLRAGCAGADCERAA